MPKSTCASRLDKAIRALEDRDPLVGTISHKMLDLLRSLRSGLGSTEIEDQVVLIAEKADDLGFMRMRVIMLRDRAERVGDARMANVLHRLATGGDVNEMVGDFQEVLDLLARPWPFEDEQHLDAVLEDRRFACDLRGRLTISSSYEHAPHITKLAEALIERDLDGVIQQFGKLDWMEKRAASDGPVRAALEALVERCIRVGRVDVGGE